MPHTASPSTGNVLLDRLSKTSRARLLEAGKTIPLTLGECIVEPDEVIEHVYFPMSGYVSLITPRGSGESLEVGMVGYEGAFGLTVLLDVRTSPVTALIQGPGTALRVSSRTFLRHVRAADELRTMMNRYLYVLVAQVAQSAACNRFHGLQSRLARWLLMSHDRARGNSFHLTHAFLAYMLGTHRPGVTVAARELRDANLITYSRGGIRVIDRAGLEARSCICYAQHVQTYNRILGRKAP